MTLTISDWNEIQQFVNKQLAQKGSYFFQGTVVKNDDANKIVWLKEFGDVPIPIIAFDFQVKYYYVDAEGNTQPKTTQPYSKDVSLLVPRVGDVVLIACQMGSRRLPKCLGVIKSTNYSGDNTDV